MTGMPGAEPNRHAVLISSASYDDPRIRSYPTIRRSAAELARIFTASPLWTSCQLVTDPAGPHAVMRAVTAAARRCAAGDTVLVYFVGHADSPRRGDGYNDIYLALRTSIRDEMWSYLALHHVYDALRAARAGAKILILDCCDCGSAPALGAADALARPPWLDDSLEPRTCVLKALRREDLAQQAPAEIREGDTVVSPYTAFSGALIEILDAGIAGVHDPMLVGDVYQRLRTRLAPRWPEPDQVVRGSPAITLLENRSAGAIRTRDIDRDQLAILRSLSAAELADAWTTGRAGLPPGAVREFIAGAVVGPGAAVAQPIAHRLHVEGADARHDELIALVLGGRSHLIGVTNRAFADSGCAECAGTAARINGHAVAAFGDDELFEYKQGFQGR